MALTMISIDEAFYRKLRERSMWLECLEEAGVDNWEGMAEAAKIRLRVLGEVRQPAASDPLDPAAPPG